MKNIAYIVITRGSIINSGSTTVQDCAGSILLDLTATHSPGGRVLAMSDIGGGVETADLEFVLLLQFSFSATISV